MPNESQEAWQDVTTQAGVFLAKRPTRERRAPARLVRTSAQHCVFRPLYRPRLSSYTIT